MKQFFRRAFGAVSSAAAAIAGELGAREIALLLGLGLVGYGAGLIYVPAGFVLPGAVLLYVSIVGLKT
jgi:hypothetical protein